MKDKKTETKRAWFEWNEDGGCHFDSLDPKTGGQLDLRDTIHAFTTLGTMIGLSVDFNSVLRENPDHPLTKTCRYIFECVEELGGGRAGKQSRVGIRKGWK